MKPKPQITPAEAAELEAATLRNIVQKVASGGVPSQREADMIRQATAAEPAPKTNLRNATNAALAKHYMVSLSTIKSWLRRYGSAVVRDPAKLQHALDGQRSGKEIDPGTPLGRARLAKLEAETIRIRHQHEVEKGLFDRRSDMLALFTRLGMESRAEWELLVQEAPLWHGLSAPDIHDRARAFVNRALTRLSAVPEELKPQ
jgi:hypothetical protein